MLSSFIGIDGKDHLLCSSNDMKINLKLDVGACLNMLVIYIGFIFGLIAWLQVDFLQD